MLMPIVYILYTVLTAIEYGLSSVVIWGVAFGCRKIVDKKDIRIDSLFLFYFCIIFFSNDRSIVPLKHLTQHRCCTQQLLLIVVVG